MAATFKTKGFALITSIFIMLLMLSLGLYATSFVITEMKISDSQANSIKAYYLAESGVAEAIWKLKNDAIWKSGFEGSASWKMDYTRNSALYPNGSYRITIANTDKAKGSILVTASLNVGGSIAQRVVKSSIYKAMGDTVVGNNGEYADGNIDMWLAIINILNGGFFSNGTVTADYWSVIDADGDVKAVGNIYKYNNSSITASSTRATNYPPAPAAIPMPAVSFDNVGDSNSYKARASHVYTATQFSDLLTANQNKTLTLNGITYVTGAVDIQYNNDLVINGALVADGNITVGKNNLLCLFLGRSNVTINNLGGGAPSGLLSKGRINFDLCMDSFIGSGLIYSNDKISFLTLPNKLNITGGLIGRSIFLTSILQGVDFTYNNTIVNSGLGSSAFSPIVTVEHWEEEY